MGRLGAKVLQAGVSLERVSQARRRVSDEQGGAPLLGLIH